MRFNTKRLSEKAKSYRITLNFEFKVVITKNNEI